MDAKDAARDRTVQDVVDVADGLMNKTEWTGADYELAGTAWSAMKKLLDNMNELRYKMRKAPAEVFSVYPPHNSNKEKFDPIEEMVTRLMNKEWDSMGDYMSGFEACKLLKPVEVSYYKLHDRIEEYEKNAM